MQKRNAKDIEELELIRKRHDGVLKAVDVVEFASDESTALHRHFTWDDGEAAQQYRIWQARQVIRVLIIEQSEISDSPIRMYVSLDDDREQDGGGYRAIVDVVTDEARLQALKQQAYRDACLFQRKYEALSKIVPQIRRLVRALATEVESDAKRNGRAKAGTAGRSSSRRTGRMPKAPSVKQTARNGERIEKS